MSKLTVVVGGQFGSEAKGHVAAQLAKDLSPGSLAVRTGGPNAGHTVIDDAGATHKLRHLPTVIAVRDDVDLALATRSVIDPRVLHAELDAWSNRQIYVDPRSTVIDQEHIEDEQTDVQMHNIGSTRKGIGAARAERIRRNARTAGQVFGSGDANVVLEYTDELIRQTIDQGADVLIEAAQGYGLGLHAGYYPHCTSADCTAIDALADCRLSPWALNAQLEVWVVLRPYPIRVAGTSGPLADETDWDRLGIAPEYTTVTNKVRRVGGWDPGLAWAAIEANGGPYDVRVALMMADQVCPTVGGMADRDEFYEFMRTPDSLELHRLLAQLLDSCGTGPSMIGTGPETVVRTECDMLIDPRVAVAS
jgi:adenylosuccinate synthase